MSEGSFGMNFFVFIGNVPFTLKWNFSHSAQTTFLKTCTCGPRNIRVVGTKKNRLAYNELAYKRLRITNT